MNPVEPSSGAEGIHLKAQATGDSTIYQAGRDQHLHFTHGVRRAQRTFRAVEADECPYPGLAAFDATRAEWFFGRDGLTADLVARLSDCLTEGGLLMVVAPSGAGKSSLLQAGLRHAITRGALPAAGSRDWPQIVFTPTAHPLRQAAARIAELADPASPTGAAPDSAQLTESLCRALRARTRPGEAAVRAIIIVDQLEELFTLCAGEGERRAFIDWLCGLARPASSEALPALVVCGLRADFYAECANYPQFRKALGAGQILVGPMSQAELREAILYPAQAAGLDIESGLVELLLRDLGSTSGDSGRAESTAGDYNAGRLPLLAHALQATWQQRNGSTLTVDGYSTTGGIQHAIATTAERAFNRLDAAGQDCARTLFLRLVKISDTGDDARRPVSRNDLLNGSRYPVVARQVLDAFTRSRLLTQARHTVEITHEALIRAWPRLRQWIDEDRSGNLIRQEIEEAAAAWSRDRRDKGRLHRGSRLDAVRRWAASPDHDLSPTASDFLTASHNHERRTVGLRRAAVAALAVGLVIAVGLAAVAAVQRSHAISERDLATFNQTAAEGLQLAGSNSPLAAELDLAAYRMRHTPDLTSRLLNDENVPLATSIPGGHGPINSVAVSPDSHILAVGDDDGTIRLWNVAEPAEPRPLGRPLHFATGSITSVAFSTNSPILAVGSNGGTIWLWNVADPAHPRPLGSPITASSNWVGQIAFSPDGRTLAVDDGSAVLLWDLANPAHPRQIGQPLSGSQQGIYYVAFSPDGKTLAAADGNSTIWLWDLANPAHSYPFGRPRPVTQGSTNDAITFSPNGRTLAVGGDNGEIQFWNVDGLARPRLLGQPLTGGADAVLAVQFSRDGQVLASGDQDGTIRLWDLADPSQPKPLGQPLYGGTGGILSVVLSPDGHLLVSGSVGGIVQLWSLPRTVLPVPAPVNSVGLSHDGRILAAGSRDGKIRLWDVTDYAQPRPLGQPLQSGIGGVWSVAFSPDGHIMAGSGDNGRIRLWDIADPASPRSLGPPLIGGREQVWSVAFSPDGHIMASASYDGTVRLWDMADPAHPRTLGPPLAVTVYDPNSITFSPSGKILAFGGSSTLTNRTVGAVELWDVTDAVHPRLRKTLTGGTNLARAVAFSSDARILVSGNYDGSVQYWQPDEHSHPLTPQIGGIDAVAFSPDGRTLAAGGATGLQLWLVTNPNHPQLSGQPLTSNTDWINSLVFSPDGSTLISGGQDNTVRLWRLNVDDAIKWICSTTGNDLTRQQWRKYIPEQPFQPPCRS